MIDAVAVAVSVGGVQALEATDLSAAPGEAVAVVGPSGSGKSTLLRALTGVQVPSSGSVTIAGVVVTALPTGARATFRREHLGVVFQDPELLEELSVVENVALPLVLAGLARRAAVARAQEQLRSMGLGDKAEASPGTLSRGEAMRAAVARALVSRPDAVIADEPTASLDRTNALAVARLLTANARAAGVATVLATHDPDVVALCDRVVDLRADAHVAHV
ncbi:ABC transporter ATP-binding protein [Cellulomonas gilvus]|uniref:ABC transporter related protein n=1 Tax=Cellulomonas gilvus (strain ATCC 13127 / NRRL B-14078) TaxID=593907 RepID=F8A5V0_CELGA|nr:ABC transporter ATP-binding protein [Cellulomonas gilvus]AEI13390.1 ABC transporter related protein [Cellulomonas gilvus ATCC 13127]